jgi:hypothetical protein
MGSDEWLNSSDGELHDSCPKVEVDVKDRESMSGLMLTSVCGEGVRDRFVSDMISLVNDLYSKGNF